MSLTSSTTPDAPTLTAGNDTITGGLGTIADTDRIIDSSTTDSDVFNATLNVATFKPQIINVETMNVTGEYTATGFDFANAVGVKTVNLAVGITGGTATVTNVAASKVAEVKAGSNVGTLVVNSDVGGTSTAVKVDTGSATTITVGAAGANTGNDIFDITLGTAATSLTLEANGTGAASSADAFTVKLVGNTLTTFVTSDGAAGDIETLTLNSTGAANTLTLTNTAGNLFVPTATGNKAVITGDKNLTLVANFDNMTGVAVEDSSTAITTLKTGATAAAANSTVDLKKVAVDVVEVSVNQGNVGLTLNESSTLKLSIDNQVTAAGALTYNIDNAAGTLTTGTLKVDVAKGQTTVLRTGAKVATLDMTANSENVTLANVVINDATTTVKLSGTKDVVVSLLTDNGTSDDTVFTAAGLSGKLTLTNTSADQFVIVGGSANDDITTTAAKANTVVRGGEGNDKITSGANATFMYGDAGADSITGGNGADVLDGGVGNDTLGGGAGADTISGGDGDDLITGGAGSNIITTGAGADKVVATVYGATPDVDWIKDFTAGTDKIVLAAANTSAIGKLLNLTALSTTNQTAVDAGATVAAAVDLAMANAGSGYTASADATAEAALFTYKGDTYLFINLDATTDAGANRLDATDYLVKLTGITGTLTTADILVA